MYIITLRINDKAKVPPLMEGHNAWIKRGFDDGIFAFVGSLQPPLAGGVILAHGSTQAEIEARVAEDPFVHGGVVSADILAVSPGRIDERLSFLKG